MGLDAEEPRLREGRASRARRTRRCRPLRRRTASYRARWRCPTIRACRSQTLANQLRVLSEQLRPQGQEHEAGAQRVELCPASALGGPARRGRREERGEEADPLGRRCSLGWALCAISSSSMHGRGEARRTHRPAGRHGVPDLRRKDGVREAGVTGREVELRIPVGPNERFGLHEGGLGPHPGRKALHAGAVAPDRDGEALGRPAAGTARGSSGGGGPSPGCRSTGRCGAGPGAARRDRGCSSSRMTTARSAGQRMLPAALTTWCHLRQVAVPEARAAGSRSGRGRVPDRADQLRVVVLEPVDAGRPRALTAPCRKRVVGGALVSTTRSPAAHLAGDVAAEGAAHRLVLERDRDQSLPPSLAVGKPLHGRPRRRAAAFPVTPGAGHEPHSKALAGEGVGQVLGVDTGGGVVAARRTA